MSPTPVLSGVLDAAPDVDLVGLEAVIARPVHVRVPADMDIEFAEQKLWERAA